ncbi:hypothetical protein LHYA1_G005073 [Lachnellula hyalina]|uniref:Peroxin 26 n=1 Tax=Lachnellula hyalina TaxID=1316788 RepID=A0A8H8R4Y3_9HELO|nr:uncharacterized protein LHYA1_G005073 [Lachnellula hyalina]TVY26944.1 hypothetical protein LHYA1_G005073 [Lachnellula hyalina]
MTSNGSIATTTLSPTRDTLLTSSISSLSSSSARHTSSQISKIYRQSSTLFLTRRLPESLSTIHPVITPPNLEDSPSDLAPVAKASRTTRIKVWSLYLTILNAIVELDPDEGKQAFGSSDWRALVSKVREGDVWEEVVKNGYGGVEGDVDSDVVINLYAHPSHQSISFEFQPHARTQKTNQTRLETYLASSTTPSLQISQSILNSSPNTPRTRSPQKSTGTDTPRDLNARVKILELYTLHVLLRNNEWDYAREFISISSVLDEERREAFLQALQSLRDEQVEAEKREGEERRWQEEQLKEARKRREEKERRRDESERGGSEVDYGVEDSHSRPSTARSAKAVSVTSSSTTPKATPPTSHSAPKQTSNSNSKSTAPPIRRTPAAAPKRLPPTLLSRASTIFKNVRKVLTQDVLAAFKTRPLFLLQLLAFIIGLVVLMGRRDVKERVRRMWGRVRETVGMGVKVSYI